MLGGTSSASSIDFVLKIPYNRFIAKANDRTLTLSKNIYMFVDDVRNIEEEKHKRLLEEISRRYSLSETQSKDVKITKFGKEDMYNNNSFYLIEMDFSLRIRETTPHTYFQEKTVIVTSKFLSNLFDLSEKSKKIPKIISFRDEKIIKTLIKGYQS